MVAPTASPMVVAMAVVLADCLVAMKVVQMAVWRETRSAELMAASKDEMLVVYLAELLVAMMVVEKDVQLVVQMVETKAVWRAVRWVYSMAGNLAACSAAR